MTERDDDTELMLTDPRGDDFGAAMGAQARQEVMVPGVHTMSPRQVGDLFGKADGGAGRPTAPALTRSGISLLTNVTRLPSAARLAAQVRIRASLVSVRNPSGSTVGSEWLSST